MILNNLRTALTGEPLNIKVKDGKIAQILPGGIHDKADLLRLNFDDAIIFPGLINSHDHLDFNLYPALGSNIYRNYTEWGEHIHKYYKGEIDNVLKVPQLLLELWGIYKNLLCGVTTVVNHGKKMRIATDMVTVFEDCQCIHSVQFEKKWRSALNDPFKKHIPVVVHTGEGTDSSAMQEIDKLLSWNLLKRQIIAVHGVSMTENQVNLFKALVWCPESNYFLLGQTAPVNRLKKHIPILFGTDSTLTGNWNIWEHIRLARKTKFLTDKELYDALTINAANTWGLDCGEIAEGKSADLVIAKNVRGKQSAGAFFSVDPKAILLVVHQGTVSMFDEELYPQLGGLNIGVYSKVYVEGACKYVKGDLPKLIKKINHYYPGASFPVA